MPDPWLSLLVLHVVILVMGSTVLWAAGRWPLTVVMVNGIIIAAGIWAMWSAGHVMETDGFEVGGLLLRVGQWTVALAIAACGLVAIVSSDRGTPAALGGWAGLANWATAMVGYWFMCFVVALFEGFIFFLGTTPHGEFR
jgi:hypothetical protein